MPYMGPAPELTYRVDPLRFADSIACVIRDLRRPSPYQLQWLVGVVNGPGYYLTWAAS